MQRMLRIPYNKGLMTYIIDVFEQDINELFEFNRTEY